MYDSFKLAYEKPCSSEIACKLSAAIVDMVSVLPTDAVKTKRKLKSKTPTKRAKKKQDKEYLDLVHKSNLEFGLPMDAWNNSFASSPKLPKPAKGNRRGRTRKSETLQS